MNMYPALKAKMGSWTYYICKMRMRELAGEVRFASEFNVDRTLDEAIQRELREGRVRKEIVSFLARRSDRFFASIVVASLGGSPTFYPVKITNEDQFKLFTDQGMDEAFGVLTFSGTQRYYALDGQHRLKAIKALLDRDDPDSQRAPEGFSEEEISVLMLVRQEAADASFLQSYRRLFSSLNRYAKPTDLDTNIIMDEDDAFAIMTRRIITEHAFFRWVGAQKESQRIQTKGKNIKTGDPYFTSLQTLYAMNKEFLSAAWRRDIGWGVGEDAELTKDTKTFMMFRPDEDYLDALYSELALYWDALLEAIPELRSEPTKKRVHDLESDNDNEVTDHLLFWPIGQEMLAAICRRLLNRRLSDPRNPDKDGVIKALKSLGSIDWRLHQPPWKYLLLTLDSPRNRWRMRNEDRVDAIKVAERILAWLLGLDDLTGEEIEELKLDWQTRLVPAQGPEDQEAMWNIIAAKRSEVSKLPT